MKATTSTDRRPARRGSRPITLPRSFRYDWRINALPAAALAALAALAGFGLGPKLWRAARAWPGLWPDPAGARIVVLEAAGFVLLLTLLSLYLLIPLLIARDAWRRRGQRVTAEEGGIAFEDGTRRVDAKWADVTGVRRRSRLPALYVVHTRTGNVEFSSTIQNAGLLLRVVRDHVPDAALRDTAGDEENELPGHAPIVTPEGATVYHYRTRTTRALIWLPASLAVAVPAVLCLRARFGETISRGEVAASSILALAELWCLWRYRAARVVVDHRGLTQYVAFGRRHIAWEEVRSIRRTPRNFIVLTVRGAGRTVRVWCGLSRLSQITGDLARRLPDRFEDH